MARAKSATVDLKVRMKEPLRAQIEKAARKAGVSMNADIVGRLERSFIEEENLHWALSRIVGEEALFRAMLAALASLRADERLDGTSWVDSPEIRREFADVFKIVLDTEAEGILAAQTSKKRKKAG